jgi:hypothetical protein
MKKISRNWPKWGLLVRAQVEALYWGSILLLIIMLLPVAIAAVFSIPWHLTTWVWKKCEKAYWKCSNVRKLVNGHVRRNDIMCSPGTNGKPSKYFIAATGEEVEFEDK